MSSDGDVWMQENALRCDVLSVQHMNMCSRVDGHCELLRIIGDKPASHNPAHSNDLCSGLPIWGNICKGFALLRHARLNFESVCALVEIRKGFKLLCKSWPELRKGSRFGKDSQMVRMCGRGHAKNRKHPHLFAKGPQFLSTGGRQNRGTKLVPLVGFVF